MMLDMVGRNNDDCNMDNREKNTVWTCVLGKNKQIDSKIHKQMKMFCLFGIWLNNKNYRQNNEV